MICFCCCRVRVCYFTMVLVCRRRRHKNGSQRLVRAQNVARAKKQKLQKNHFRVLNTRCQCVGDTLFAHLAEEQKKKKWSFFFLLRFLWNFNVYKSRWLWVYDVWVCVCVCVCRLWGKTWQEDTDWDYNSDRLSLCILIIVTWKCGGNVIYMNRHIYESRPKICGNGRRSSTRISHSAVPHPAMP